MLNKLNADMKNMERITVTLLVLLVTGSLSLNAQRGMRGMRSDTTRMNRPGMEQIPKDRMMPAPDLMQMGMMHRGMRRMQMNNMPPFMGPMFGMNQPGPGERRFGPEGRGSKPEGTFPEAVGRGPDRDMMNRDRGMMPPRMIPFQGMRGDAPGLPFFENIPNLTDKQKQDIEELSKKQQNEMEKFRTEMQEKMKAIRESQRAKVMGLLTDEQKKWFDEKNPKPTN
jgi:hypothetical protein